MLPDTIYTRLSAQIDSDVTTAELRTATYNGVEHIVVPVVALVGDEVIHSATAESPELVPSDVISIAPGGWNGRPCVPDHPKVNGKYVSANSPEVLESRKFGEVFNSRFEDGKLKFDAYLNPSIANNIGKDAVGIIEKLQNSEMVEISTGCFITKVNESGTINGKEYSAVWASVVPDHLAFLTKSEGACNIGMGCGAPRINENITVDGNKEIRTMNVKNTGNVKCNPSFLQRILSKLRLNEIFDDGDSDQDLRSVISKALREIESGFDYLCHVYTDSGMIVYTIYNYNVGGYNLTWWRRSYSIDDNKNVTFGTDKVQVRPVEKFELVENEGKDNESADVTSNDIVNSDTTNNENTKGGGNKEETKTETNQTENKEIQVEGLQVNDCKCQKGEKEMVTALDRKKVIERLTSLTSGPFTKNVKALEAMDDDGLRALDEGFPDKAQDKPTEKTEKVETKVEVEDEEDEEIEDDAAEVEEESEEKFLARAPKSIRDMVNRHKQMDQEYRNELIEALEETKQDVYTKVELSAMETEQLEKVSRLLKVNSTDTRTANTPVVRNFTGRGFPRTNNKEDDVYTNYPKPYDIALNKGKEKKAASGQ